MRSIVFGGMLEVHRIEAFMELERVSLGLVISMVSLIGGCFAAQPQVGLSNVRSVSQSAYQLRPEEDDFHDTIANGRDSCQRPDSKRKDPVPYRFQPCDSEVEGVTIAAHPAPVAGAASHARDATAGVAGRAEGR